MSKGITHTKDLKEETGCMDNFMKAAAGIRNKKGCLLIQFPGKVSFDHFNNVERIMEGIKMLDPENQWKKAVEFRDAGWYIAETWEMLAAFNASVVLHDKPKAKFFEVKGNSGHVYVRFHGPEGDYRGSYTDSFLQKTAMQIRQWAKDGKEVYVYFNNTIGDAYGNAMSLKRILNA